MLKDLCPCALPNSKIPKTLNCQTRHILFYWASRDSWISSSPHLLGTGLGCPSLGPVQTFSTSRPATLSLLQIEKAAQSTIVMRLLPVPLLPTHDTGKLFQRRKLSPSELVAFAQLSTGQPETNSRSICLQRKCALLHYNHPPYNLGEKQKLGPCL